MVYQGKTNIEQVKDRVLEKYPSFGDKIFDVKITATKEAVTAATNGKEIFYNPDFFDILTDDEKDFVFAHEVCHIAMDHINRGGDKKHKELWNIATDACINAYLKQDGLELQPKPVLDKNGRPVFDKDGNQQMWSGVNIADGLYRDAETIYEKLVAKLELPQDKNGDDPQNQDKDQQKEQGQGQQDEKKQNEENANQDDAKGKQNKEGQNQQDDKQDSGEQDGKGQEPQGDKQNAGDKDNQEQSQQSGDNKDSQNDQGQGQQEDGKQDSQSGQGDGAGEDNQKSQGDSGGGQDQGQDGEQRQGQDGGQEQSGENASQGQQGGEHKPQGNNGKAGDKQQDQANDNDKIGGGLDDIDLDKYQTANHKFWDKKEQKKSEDYKTSSGSEKQGLVDKIKERHGVPKHKDLDDAPNSEEEVGDIPNEGKIEKISEGEQFFKNDAERAKKLKEIAKIAIRSIFETAGIKDYVNVKPVLSWKRVLVKSMEEMEDAWVYRRSSQFNPNVRVDEIEQDERAITEVVLDVSGSIGDDLLRGFLRQLVPLLKDSDIRVGCFDDNFYGFKELKTKKQIEEFRATRGGYGTNFEAAATAFTHKPRRRTNKIVFTDGQLGSNPRTEAKDVIWLVFGGKSDFKPIGGKIVKIRNEELEKMKLEADFNRFQCDEKIF